MGETGENVAERWQVSRERQDAFALASHRKAIAAIEAGRFDSQIVPVEVRRQARRARPVVVGRDEHPRADTSPRGAGRAPARLPRWRHRHGRQQLGDQRRRQRRAPGRGRSGPRPRPAPARPDRLDGRRRRRSRDHGHRARAGQPQGPRAGRDLGVARPRPGRAQRGVRQPVAGLHRRARPRSRIGSTSTAARSPWAIPSG